MNRFLPREKMNKRQKRELDLAKRATWDGINPVTRRATNKTAYNRKQSPRWYNDDSMGIVRFSGLFPSFPHRECDKTGTEQPKQSSSPRESA